MVDVAERAGVSHSTVSRVLSGQAVVHPETQALVLEAVQDLGYVVNKQARALAGGYSGVIGVVVYQITSLYVGKFLSDLEKHLADSGYMLLLASTHGYQQEGSSPIPYVRRLVQHNICDGLILLFPGYQKLYVDERNRQTLPFVLVDEPETAAGDSVYIDHKVGTRLAMDHLADLGHHRIGFIGGLTISPTSRHRQEVYIAVTHERGLSTDPELMRDGDFGQRRAIEATGELLSLKDPPTAIFAGCDDAAIGVIKACREHGLSVPDDISVIGYDDLQIAETSIPALTTVHQPIEQLTERALTRLLWRIENPSLAFEETRVLPTLVVRDSTAPPPSR